MANASYNISIIINNFEAAAISMYSSAIVVVALQEFQKPKSFAVRYF
jgi:hypothetical protein